MSRPLQQFAGLELIPTYIKSAGNVSTYDPVNFQPISDGEYFANLEKNFMVGIGAHYLISYKLTAKITVRATATIQVDPEKLLSNDDGLSSNYAPHSKTAVDFGIAYKLQ